MSSTVSIGDKIVGAGHPTYIIAEMSGNHLQDFDCAVRILHEMKAAGADAVKLLTFTPDSITLQCNKREFMIEKGTAWEGRNLYELYEELYAPWDWQPKLMNLAKELGMDLFSTPHDTKAVDFLDEMGVPAFKVASFELVDIPLIRYIAAKGKPVIISTGMGSIQEIQDAVDTVHSSKNDQIILLKCTSAYPAKPEEMNLATIPDMIERFELLVGLSDHSLEQEVPLTAVALGACVIEKHFTLDRGKPGPDNAFSLEPHEFKEMVHAIRAYEQAPEPKQKLNETILGNVFYGASGQDKKSLQFRRSLFVVKNMQKGEAFTEENVRSIRPANGLPPKAFENVLG